MSRVRSTPSVRELRLRGSLVDCGSWQMQDDVDVFTEHKVSANVAAHRG